MKNSSTIDCEKPQMRELSAAEVNSASGGIAPLLAGLILFDLFGVGVNIGLWGPEIWGD